MLATLILHQSVFNKLPSVFQLLETESLFMLDTWSLSHPVPPPPPCHPANRSPWWAADHHGGSCWRFRWVVFFFHNEQFGCSCLVSGLIQIIWLGFSLIHILRFLHPSCQKPLRFLQEVVFGATAQPAEPQNKQQWLELVWNFGNSKPSVTALLLLKSG